MSQDEPVVWTGISLPVTDDPPRYPQPASPEERLLLAIYGRNPDDAGEVRNLRYHAATCTTADHTWCFPYPAQEQESGS
jgi:hypothetical protein